MIDGVNMDGLRETLEEGRELTEAQKAIAREFEEKDADESEIVLASPS